MIDSAAVVIVALEGVAVYEPDLGVPVDGDPPGALPRHPILVLRVHYALAEVALIDVEVGTVQRDQPRQQDVLYLL